MILASRLPHPAYGRRSAGAYRTYTMRYQSMNSAPPPMTSRRSLLTPDSLRATLRVVDNPIDPGSGIHTAAQFVVEDGQAGPQPA